MKKIIPILVLIILVASIPVYAVEADSLRDASIEAVFIRDNANNLYATECWCVANGRTSSICTAIQFVSPFDGESSTTDQIERENRTVSADSIATFIIFGNNTYNDTYTNSGNTVTGRWDHTATRSVVSLVTDHEILYNRSYSLSYYYTNIYPEYE